METPHAPRPVALVTGGAGPVGQAVIRRLSADGYAVAGLDTRECSADCALTVDVTDRAEMKAAARSAAEELGPVSVLVTAQSRHASAPFGELDWNEWRLLLDTYLGGTVNACAAVVPDMVAAGGGTVVTMSSWLALAGVPGESYLAAATGTILAFTKSFAIEVAPSGVRVNCIAVGPLEDERPQAQPVLPGQVADTVSFLVRDGDFMVGQVLNAVSGAVV